VRETRGPFIELTWGVAGGPAGGRSLLRSGWSCCVETPDMTCTVTVFEGLRQ